ncbi:hypothetical protein PGT21_034507 [Puccinia graminis f. sp. tritici]|uniref:Uncharacterized protein n=1 Tax=Puccinia graminis f. sp. tritici TaxID=56615 RepID=A0A5B0LQ76_PUCGR|nr:hypothetical protein PGT21_034507 [Puccinia graminis f. sp. tritici]KAA1081776.1 hypothetical protein PGTUg99_005631 [Puccinia graminis f. sp. tritici]
MNVALLPIFGGELHESWELHELRLLSWFRVHQIPEDNDKLRIDFLILSLKPNSSPLSWFNGQPTELKSTFLLTLSLLRDKYGSKFRKEMQRISALNCLEVRSFRDSEHKTEMVFELVNELEQLLTCGSVEQDVQRREYLLRCFRGFSGALKMMNRSTSYDGAVLAALNWESSVISKAEEAMIQAGIKRQLGQKSQNTQARTKRKSDLTQPANQSDQQTTGDLAHLFTTQDFQANTDPVRIHPDVYFKTHSRPNPQQKPFQNPSHENSSHPLQQRFDDLDHRQGTSHQEASHKQNGESNHTVGNASSTSANAYVTPPTRDDTDPSQMMESLVDPHIAPEQSYTHPQRSDDQPNRYDRFAHMNQNEQEVLHNPGLVNTYPQKSQMKPLVYDPKKNPYPPPEQLPENRPQVQTQFSSLPPSHLLERNGQNATTFKTQDLGQPSRLHTSNNRSANSSHPDSIPFPSPSVQTQALPSFQPARKSPIPHMISEQQQSTRMLPGSSSSQQGARFFDSATNLDSAPSLIQAQFSFDPLSQRRSGGISPAPQRRPSKLVKLRRNPSNSSNNSSVGQRSSSSLRQIRSFIGSINRRRSQASQSGEESDSTQDHGPNTPSSLEPGGIGSGFESEGNERMRPMQAQFSRLFRKHNHPEHLRRANRAMLISKYASNGQKADDKGKARAIDVNSAASGVVDEFFSQRNQAAGRSTKSSTKPHSSAPVPHPPMTNQTRRGYGGTESAIQQNKASSKFSRWRNSGI